MKTGYRIFALFLMAGLLAWVIDAVVDSVVFREQGFWDAAILRVPGPEAVERLTVLAGLAAAGLVTGVVVARHHMQEQQCRSIVAQLGEGFALLEVISDPAGRPADYRIVDVNPAALEIAGLPREQLVGRTLLEVAPGAEQHWLTALAEAALTGRPGRFEGYSNRFQKHFSVIACRPARRRIALLFQDVTAQKRLAEQAQEAAKLEAIGRLAGGIAHEFNNMLAIIRGYADLLLDAPAADEETRSDLRRIRTAASRAATLVDQLLTFSSRQPARPRSVRLNDVIARARRRIEEIAGEGVQLVTDLAGDPWPVTADPDQVERLLVNLAVNACEAMPAGGRLTLRTRNVTLQRPGAGEDPAVPPGQYAVLVVADDGVGMDEAVRGRIFEPFFTTKQTARAAGFGLPACYGIVKQNGGHLWLYSRPGSGTTFHIYLPRAPLTRPAPRP